jgi:hypothetical protein
VYYAESWKKGGTRQVNEKRIRIRLDASVPSYETVVTDGSGEGRFRLRIDPYYYIRGDSGDWKLRREVSAADDSTVSFWNVLLLDQDEPASLLLADHGTGGHTIHLENTFASLYPIEDENWIKVGIFGVPISRKRVIKVEGFYCVIWVRGYELSKTNARAFDWVDVEIELTNSKPDIPNLRPVR